MEKAEAYDERFEEVGWGRTTCEGGEQGSASFCGVAGGKGLNQGESGLPKHVPNPVSGKRATGGGPDTESFCRQSPEVGAGWFNDHVRICAGGAQQCAFLPQPRAVHGCQDCVPVLPRSGSAAVAWPRACRPDACSTFLLWVTGPTMGPSSCLRLRSLAVPHDAYRF